MPATLNQAAGMGPTQAGHTPTGHHGPDTLCACPQMASGSAPGYQTPASHDIGPIPATTDQAFDMAPTLARHAPTDLPGPDALYARPHMTPGSAPGNRTPAGHDIRPTSATSNQAAGMGPTLAGHTSAGLPGPDNRPAAS